MTLIVSTDIRALSREDIPSAAAIDAEGRSQSRASYLQRRVAAALRDPSLHIQLAAEDDEGLSGFAIARVLEGEFGRVRPALQLEVIGVRADVQAQGIGSRLLAELMRRGRQHDATEIDTQSAWTDYAMLRWLQRHEFRLASCHVLDFPVELGRSAPARAEQDPDNVEIDYSGTRVTVAERLARDLADVRTMAEADLAEITRIDRNITGHDRARYIRHKLTEALQDSAVRVSLTARVDGVIAGFLMARADYGDFGRPEAVAVLDTIGVDPGFTHRGVAHALLSQLCANLSALQIERVETIVAPHDVGLLGFLYEAGFAPSQRLPFSRGLGA